MINRPCCHVSTLCDELRISRSDPRLAKGVTELIVVEEVGSQLARVN